MLDEAALDTERISITPDQIQLVLQAEQWLLKHGWEPHHIRGWSNVGRAFGVMKGYNGLWIRERRRGYWDGSGERHPVRSVLAGLNILVNEEILPACFSTLGQNALADFAEALERAAVRLDDQNDQKSGRSGWTAQDRLLEFARADGLRKAAAVAREHSPASVLA
jgi:hypothetical protein